MRKVIHGNKMRTLASKSIRIQKALGKIVVDNNQKVTWILFYYQLSKLHQSEAKTLQFYKTCELFDLTVTEKSTKIPLPVIFLYLPEPDKAVTERGW